MAQGNIEKHIGGWNPILQGLGCCKKLWSDDIIQGGVPPVVSFLLYNSHYKGTNIYKYILSTINHRIQLEKCTNNLTITMVDRCISHYPQYIFRL